MEYRRLGGSGLKVSEIGMGCNNFGMRIDQEQTTVVVRAALDAGITLFDTADVYGLQQSESMLGKALGADRSKVVIATKFGVKLPEWEHAGGSRQHVIRAAEASLKRLGTDYIDLYQIHKPDPETPVEETLRALDDLVTSGKVRYIGCSNFTGWQIADADWTARTEGLNRFVSAQNEYSLLVRKSEAEVIPACERFGLGLIPFFPLALGVLTGKYRRGVEPAVGTRLGPGSRRTPANPINPLTDENFDRVEKLTVYAEVRGKTLLDLAFAWLLGHPVVSSVIAGATKPEQVQANVATAQWRLSPAEVAEIDELIA